MIVITAVEKCSTRDVMEFSGNKNFQFFDIGSLLRRLIQQYF